MSRPRGGSGLSIALAWAAPAAAGACVVALMSDGVRPQVGCMAWCASFVLMAVALTMQRTGGVATGARGFPVLHAETQSPAFPPPAVGSPHE